MKKTVAASIDESVVSRVRAEAEREKRSFSQMLEILASEALEARAKGGK